MSESVRLEAEGGEDGKQQQTAVTEEERLEREKWEEHVRYEAAVLFNLPHNSAAPAGVNNMYPCDFEDFVKYTERCMLQEMARDKARKAEAERLAALRDKLIKAGVLDPAPPIRLF